MKDPNKALEQIAAIIGPVVTCSDCGTDATNDRACNGDGVVRCNACATAKYKHDCPLWFLPKRKLPVIFISA